MKTPCHWPCALLLGFLTLISAACKQNLTSGQETSRPPSQTRVVRVFGAMVGEQRVQLEQALVPFEQETGIDVIYEGSDAFATNLPLKIETGNVPDVAAFPQPGLLRELARDGQLVSVNSFISTQKLKNAYSDSWLELGSFDNQVYGIGYRVSLKSLVWYNPKVFAAQGYQVPTTWDEMIALSDQMVAEGRTPWCIGLESGDATGWPGTDWIEDIMLRTVGPEVYDQWVNHEIEFNDPRVIAAFERWGQILLHPHYVAGGTVGALNTPTWDVFNSLWSDPPSCYLHRQANFIQSLFPSTVVLGEDVNFFVLPEINPQWETPVLVAGDIFAMLRDTPESRALMEYLLTPTPHEAWIQLGGFLSPHRQVNLELYPDLLSKRQAEILLKSNIVRFDGSDMMPAVVGTGSFWTGIIDYTSGIPAQTVVDHIEASWPELQAP
jgi:alpha-glucoside transport system substrate-binding protein